MRRSRPWYIWMLGGVLWALVGVLVLALASPIVAEPYARRRVICALCGAREIRTEYGSITLACAPMARVGEAWWAELAPANHAHEWHTVGCVEGIGKVSCTEIYERDLFLGILPRFRDQSLARRVAERLVSMEPEARWREHLDSRRLSGIDLLVTPDDDGLTSMRPDIQFNAYAEWRAEHPIWHDLFSPTLAEIEAGR